MKLCVCLKLNSGFSEEWLYMRKPCYIGIDYLDYYTSWSWLNERSSSTIFVRPLKAWPSTWANPQRDNETLCKLISPRLENWWAFKTGIEFPDMFKAARKKIMWINMRAEKVCTKLPRKSCDMFTLSSCLLSSYPKFCVGHKIALRFFVLKITTHG